MRRNCNLELPLFPASTSYLSSSGADSDHQERTEKLTSHHEISPKAPNNRPLTIFYNGKICVCNVSEFQARAILLLARRDMEERMRTPTVAELGSVSRSGSGLGPCSPSLQSPAYRPIAAQSMKMSLQRFLQNRKHRAVTMSPYHR